MNKSPSQAKSQNESFKEVARSDDSRSSGMGKTPRRGRYLWYSLIPFVIIAVGSYGGFIGPEPGDVSLVRVLTCVLASVCLFLATVVASMTVAALAALVASRVLKKNAGPTMFRVYMTLMLAMAVMICTALLLAGKSGGHHKGGHKKKTYFFHGGPQF